MAISHLSSSSFSFTFSSPACLHFLFSPLPRPHLLLRLLPDPRRSPSPRCSAQRSSKKGRPSRAQKTDEELSLELREFASSLGFPGGHVPSMKDLIENGRKDLAHIVRRRGYKAIKELLGFSTLKENVSSETSITQEDSAASVVMTENAEAEEVITNVSLMCSLSSNPIAEEKIAVQEDYTNMLTNGNTEVQEVATSVSLMCASSNNPTIEKEITVQSNGAVLTSDDSQVDQVTNDSIVSLQLKSAKFIQSGELDALEDEDDNSSVDATFMAQEQPNQSEIDLLKQLLHQKELELAHLKRLIENEKISLYNLQAKAKAEFDHVQSNVAEKDAELQTFEENLSGLKEVYIEFYANAQAVEVAGSFNGWHHRVTMDPRPQSESEGTDGDRIPLLWSTILWLYPGVYEIKFVVDGQWIVDSQREIVTTGNVTNNVIRVS